MAEATAPSKKVLADLKASILNPALTSHFECDFNPPTNEKFTDWISKKSGAGLGIKYQGNETFFKLSCAEASLPGSSLATHELNNDHTGVTERHVYRRQYDDRASFTFYVDHDYNIIYFFENWISFIVNEQFATGVEEKYFNYRVNFPKYYSSTIMITKFERDYTGRILKYQFINAYPISIDSMPVSYDSSQLLKCTVSFNYSRYVTSTQLTNSEVIPLEVIPFQPPGTQPTSTGQPQQPTPPPTTTQNRQGVARDPTTGRLIR